MRSETAAAPQAPVASVTVSSICSGGRLSPARPAQRQAAGGHQEGALRYFSMTQSREPGSSEGEVTLSPLPPPSSAGLRQQEESGSEHPEEEEEEARGRQQGGVSEQESSSEGTQHPQRSGRRDESKALSGEPQGRGERGGRGLHPPEASSKQEQERSSGQTRISGRRVR